MICLLVVAVVMSTPCVMSQRTCPAISNVTVRLFSSIEQNGRQFACPGEHVTFTCEVNQSVIARISAENFICRSDAVSFLATDDVGSSGGTSLFQVNLTNVQRGSNLMANFTVTLTTITTSETSNTVVECGDVLTSELVQRKDLIQSSQPSPPTGLNHTFDCIDPDCVSEELTNGSTRVTCECRSIDLILTWNDGSGLFDVQHYLVNISGNITTETTTSHTISVIPDRDYLVLVSTVTECQQTSSPAMTEESIEGVVRAAPNTTAVVPPTDGPTDGPPVGIIIGSVSGGIAIPLLMIIAILCWCNRKRNKVTYGRVADDGSNMNNQQTPLHVAAKKGNLDRVRRLIDEGANVNSKDSDGKTPLHLAAKGDHVDIVRYLIDKGADVDVKSDDGWTPLHIASREGYKLTVKSLVESEADMNATSHGGVTPLHMAAKYGHKDTVECLVDGGADSKAKDINGRTPLHMATRGGHENIVKHLIGKGADINIKDRDGMTPLHVAARGGYEPIVKHLVSEKADINSKDNDGWTSLHIAAREGYFRTVKSLVESKAGINIKSDDWMMTPLHMAVERDRIRVVKFLVGNGADINSEDKKGRTPLDVAIERCHIDIKEYLVGRKEETVKEEARAETVL